MLNAATHDSAVDRTTASTRSITGGESVTDSRFGKDVAGLDRVCFNLPADVRDMNPKILLRVACRFSRPRGGKKLLVCHRPPTVAHELASQVPFDWSQMNNAAGQCDRPRGEIHRELAARDYTHPW